MSDRIVVMNEGRIVQAGSPAEIYNHPNTVFASQFIGEANLLSGRVEDEGEDGTVVALDGLRLLGPRAQLERGSGAVVSVRPERVRVAPVGCAPDAENCFRGRIRQVIFLGHSRRYDVEIAPDVIVTAQTAIEDELDEADVGDEVEVRWLKSNSTLLPAS